MEARQLGHNYIGTEHILLGLIREGEGVGTEVLARLGVDLKDARATVLALIEDLSHEGHPMVAHLEAGAPTMPDPDELAVARNGLIRRMLEDDGTLLAQGLREHGIEPLDFLATLDRLAEGD